MSVCVVGGFDAGRPINHVEDEEHEWKHDQEDVVHFGPEFLLPLRPDFALLVAHFPDLFALQPRLFLLPQQVCVARQSSEDEEDANEHPGRDGRHSLDVRRIGCNNLEGRYIDC